MTFLSTGCKPSLPPTTIKDNIEYEHLATDKTIDRDCLDGIVEIILETVCTARKTLRIAGDDYPAEFVKAKFMKLDSGHIQFVFDCMRENTTEIRNIKQYLRAVLLRPDHHTIDSYYTALVAHDMKSGSLRKSRSLATRTIIPTNRAKAFNKQRRIYYEIGSFDF